MVPRTGSVVFDGDETTRLATHEIVRRGVAYVPEDRDVFAGLTVEENLRLAERAGAPLRYDLVYELFPELKQRAAQKAGTLSGGQQQMVALARALLNGDNRILLVDEPTKGLAPLVVRHVVDALRRAAEVDDDPAGRAEPQRRAQPRARRRRARSGARVVHRRRRAAHGRSRARAPPPRSRRGGEPLMWRSHQA